MTNDSPVNFHESEWLKLVFLLADIQTWIDDMNKEALRVLPMRKKKFIRKTYYLSVSALAHIIERHYHKIPRYPNAGKFHIPVIEILHLIRKAYSLPVCPAPGGQNFQRVITAENNIGFDKYGIPTNAITILTDAGGRIITAFPGTNPSSEIEAV